MTIEDFHKIIKLNNIILLDFFLKYNLSEYSEALCKKDNDLNIEIPDVVEMSLNKYIDNQKNIKLDKKNIHIFNKDIFFSEDEVHINLLSSHSINLTIPDSFSPLLNLVIEDK